MAVLEDDEKHGFWTYACIHAPLSTWSKKQKTGMTESNWKYKFEISQSFAYECCFLGLLLETCMKIVVLVPLRS